MKDKIKTIFAWMCMQFQKVTFKLSQIIHTNKEEDSKLYESPTTTKLLNVNIQTSNFNAFFALINLLFRDTLTKIAFTALPEIINACLTIYIYGYLLEYVQITTTIPYVIYVIAFHLSYSLIRGSYLCSCFAMLTMIDSRFIQQILTSPLKTGTIILCLLINSCFRSIIPVICYFCISLFVFKGLSTNVFTLDIFNIYGKIILVGLLIIFLFSSIGIIVAVLTRDVQKASAVTNFIITPLSYLGGGLFDISHAPSFIKFAAIFNPIFYCNAMLRQCFTGEAISIVTVGVFLVLITVAFMLASMAFNVLYDEQ